MTGRLKRTQSPRIAPGEAADIFGTSAIPDAGLDALMARTLVFSVLTAEERLVLQRLMRRVSFEPGELLFRQGAAPDGLYIMEEGDVDISIRVPGNRGIVLGRVGAPEVFGEMALAAPQLERSASARAATRAQAWFLDARVFRGLCALHHPLGFKLLRHLGLLLSLRLRKRYTVLAGAPPAAGSVGDPATVDGPNLTAEELAIAGVLPCFRRLSETELAELVTYLIRLEAPRGRVLFDEGDMAGACHFVLRGAVEMMVRTPDGPMRLAVLGPGQTVGHPGLLDDAPPGGAATVREAAILATLPRTAIAKLLEQQSALTLRVLEIINEALVLAIRRTDMRAARTTAALGASG